MHIDIQPVTRSDVDKLQMISRQTFSETFSEQNDTANMQTYLNRELSRKQLESEVSNSNSKFYFAVIDQEITGYLKINLDGDVLEVQRIYVLEKFKGKGIGSMLMKQSEHLARLSNISTLTLGVWEHNDPAIKFYKSKGFKRVGEKNFNLGEDIQTDYILTKSIY